jgi:ribosomal 50S subunit-recycling heat shock protein
MSYSSLMSDSQVLKFNKYVAKHTKKVMMEKEIEIITYRMQLKVKVSTIIAPKGRWDDFRVNVKVVECKVKCSVWNQDGTRARDNNGDLVFEYLPRQIKRSDVNNTNSNIRREVGYKCREMLCFFGIDGWRVKVEKVSHS